MMNLSLLRWTFGVLLLWPILAHTPACAQFSAPSIPPGSYVFSQAGPAFTSLARLDFAADGTVTGVEVHWSYCTVGTYALQGTSSSAGNKINLILDATRLDTTDGIGDALTFVETVELLQTSTGEFLTIRTDGGMPATGTLMPSGGQPARGAYVLSGKPIDPAAVSVELVTLDGAGGVSGRALLNAYGVTSVVELSGSYGSRPDGFLTLTRTWQNTDSDGNTLSSTETYAMLATRKDLRLMRIDIGPGGIVVLSK